MYVVVIVVSVDYNFFLLADKNYLIISIESENGVTREYCSIDMIVKPLVAGFNAIKNVEEYL